MDITKTDTKLLKVADLRPNEGQIPDVPSNPRFITESEYEKLCNSLRECIGRYFAAMTKSKSLVSLPLQMMSTRNR